MCYVVHAAIKVKQRSYCDDLMINNNNSDQEHTHLDELYVTYPKQNIKERFQRRRKASYFVPTEAPSHRSDSEVAKTMLSLIMNPENIQRLSPVTETNLSLLKTLSNLQEDILEDKKDCAYFSMNPHEMVWKQKACVFKV